MITTKSSVNEKFYNKIAPIYDRITPHRSSTSWIDKQIRYLADSTGGKTFLDVCAGSGIVSKIATKYFKQVVAVDVSEKMLALIDSPHIETVKMSACDIKSIWYKHFDVVCCFAGLHHLPNPMQLILAANHVLKYNGMFYSDHDLCGTFYSKWKHLIEFKRMFDLARVPEHLWEEYQASEIHSKGITSNLAHIWMVDYRNVSITTHWQGTLPISHQFAIGKAPYVRITGRKGL